MSAPPSECLKFGLSYATVYHNGLVKWGGRPRKCELLPHFPRQGFVHTVGKGYSYLGLDGNCMPVYQIN
jgi:hypothetical protein